MKHLDRLNTDKLVDKIESITEDLGGSIQKLTTFDSTGRTSNKIVIEYNEKQQERK